MADPGFSRVGGSSGHEKLLLPPTTKLRQSNVSTPVSDSVHRWGFSVRGGGGVCLGDIRPGGSLLVGVCGQGVSLQGGVLSTGDLCPGRGLYPGVSVQGGFCVQRGSLSRGVSVRDIPPTCHTVTYG